MQPSRINNTCVLRLLVTVLILVSNALPQCEVSVGKGTKAADWDEIFTQSGPGQKLKPKNAAGWTGGDSTDSIICHSLHRAATLFSPRFTARDFSESRAKG